MSSLRVRRCVWFVSVALVVAMFAIIFILTVQAPQESASLSLRVEQKLSPVDGMTANGSLWAAAKIFIRSVAARLFAIANVRKWAHAGEFFVLGFFVAIAALTWPSRRGGQNGALVRRFAVALAVCAACSLFDQSHKLIVPGRHFDALDLVFDAMGYGLALVLTFVPSAIFARRRKQHAMSSM